MYSVSDFISVHFQLETTISDWFQDSSKAG